ncbi:T9SS type A sorting domain-containing protein, partial [Algoriella sp.]|uniref:T9SS type A sorting domain-containing protein n=1 Tax=Algoriella sp. TaxID=1872434 RepID=UPI001B0CFEB5
DKINFYPNPVNDLLTIQHAKKITSIEIFNLAGLKVKSSLINTNKETISLANLPSGVYIVNAIIEGKNQTFKIVKK